MLKSKTSSFLNKIITIKYIKKHKKKYKPIRKGIPPLKKKKKETNTMNKDFILQQTTQPEKKYRSGVLIGKLSRTQSQQTPWQRAMELFRLPSEVDS